MKQDPFKEYIKESEPDKREKGYVWHTAIGLQAVDGLKTSEYLLHTAVRNIEGEITIEEANALLQSYYEENPSCDDGDRTEEADKVSARIAAILSERAFSFTPNEYLSIHETTEYLELFLRNLLLDERNPLHNRTMHISGAFKEKIKVDIETVKVDIETEKTDIETEKVDIETNKADIKAKKTDIEMKKTGAEIMKADIEGKFQPKTASHILKLYETFTHETVFGRSDVMKVVDIKPSRASALLKEMTEQKIIELVFGYGKGKYRFRYYGNTD